MMKKRGVKLVICIVVILVVVFCGSKWYEVYEYNHGWSGKYNNTRPQEGQIRVVCVGDSITYGHSVENWEENNYPVVLQELLGETYHVANYGSSGACVNPQGDAPYTERKAYERSLVYDADILIFMLGTNDTKPQNWTDTQTFVEDYKELLESYLQGTPPPKVYVGLCAKAYDVKDKGDGLAAYKIQPEIVDEIVEVIADAMKEVDYEVEILDVYSITADHPEWYVQDGIHLNQDGARAVADLAAEAILNIER